MLNYGVSKVFRSAFSRSISGALAVRWLVLSIGDLGQRGDALQLVAVRVLHFLAVLDVALRLVNLDDAAHLLDGTALLGTSLASELDVALTALEASLSSNGHSLVASDILKTALLLFVADRHPCSKDHNGHTEQHSHKDKDPSVLVRDEVFITTALLKVGVVNILDVDQNRLFDTLGGSYTLDAGQLH